jgi:hypothetical protein
MTSVNAVNDKFVKGKGLSDAELSTLIYFYITLDNNLEDTDNVFKLFKLEIRRRLDMLRSFADARVRNHN